jgi:hypothetical protein
MKDNIFAFGYTDSLPAGGAHLPVGHPKELRSENDVIGGKSLLPR